MATVTLATTTLNAPLGRGDSMITVASSAGIFPGTCLYMDQELMQVSGIGVSSSVGVQLNVRRGIGGTLSTLHTSGIPIYIGTGDQFFSSDPQGRPNAVVYVDPHINAQGGRIWRAQGDSLPEGNANRWWQQVVPSYTDGPMGVRVLTYSPTVGS